MAEFGEKIKKLREEKGMTQQTMADELYVTRQAVSRWECGARYPDLQTTKKISMILGVSVDELLSEEELKENVEKKPLLIRPLENITQTILYAVSATAYVQMCIINIYSLAFPNPGLEGTPAGKIDAAIIMTIIGYVISMAVYLTGTILSLRNKLSAKATGYIMCTPFIIKAVNALVTYLEVKIKHNGYMPIISFIISLAVPMAFAACILIYFANYTILKNKISYLVIWGICAIAAVYVIQIVKQRMHYITDLGFVVMTIHVCGIIGMIFLLAYQAYIWDRKKRMENESHTSDSTHF